MSNGRRTPTNAKQPDPDCPVGLSERSGERPIRMGVWRYAPTIIREPGLVSGVIDGLQRCIGRIGEERRDGRAYGQRRRHEFIIGGDALAMREVAQRGVRLGID